VSGVVQPQQGGEAHAVHQVHQHLRHVVGVDRGPDLLLMLQLHDHGGQQRAVALHVGAQHRGCPGIRRRVAPQLQSHAPLDARLPVVRQRGLDQRQQVVDADAAGQRARQALLDARAGPGEGRRDDAGLALEVVRQHADRAAHGARDAARGEGCHAVGGDEAGRHLGDFPASLVVVQLAHCAEFSGSGATLLRIASQRVFA
jgi:hypothetical protein